MPLKLPTLLLMLLYSICSHTQDESLLDSSTIPILLRINANAVVRYDKIDIEVKAFDKLVVKNTRVVTILSKEGSSKEGAVLHYDDNVTIHTLEAHIYDGSGEEIKKIKKNDFEDVSAVSGGTLYSDSRLKYLNYTAVTYPYTLFLETEVTYRSTAFFPGWRPLEGFYTSTESAEYKITNETDLEIKIKTDNFETFGIEKHSDYHYTARDLYALKPEAYSPSFKTYAPFLRAALTQFSMEGVDGENNNWTDFGKWMHDRLLLGTEVLPEDVKAEIKELTKNATTQRDKAKIVYNYVQGKTRYISVQIGIGGWKPMLAHDVDRLGYADCKGLSNYTKALLNEVGVEAHYAVIYGGRDIVDMDSEFSATEGNHAVMYIPDDRDGIWLECTSQTNPFGFIAGFTDDRDALLITPDGGKIVHTTTYKTEDNLQSTNAYVKLMADGSFTSTVKIETKGYQYAKHDGIQYRPERDQDLYYKDYWDYINNISLDGISFNNDKDAVVFTENIRVSSSNFAASSGNRLLFQPNLFNRFDQIPARYENRTLDFEIYRGFKDEDEFVIDIEDSLDVEAMPENVDLENQFGSYSCSIEKLSESKLSYKRTFILNKGYYSKEAYEDFRGFLVKVVKYDKNKIVLISKT